MSIDVCEAQEIKDGKIRVIRTYYDASALEQQFLG